MILQSDSETIYYTRFGLGPGLLFCLSGYGETGASFEWLAKALGDTFTVICPDLPLHGNTPWQEESFSIEQLQQLLVGMAKQEGFEGKHFSLAGFSMGGRLAMAYAGQYPGTLNSLILIAPDGLHQNFWYWLSTQTSLGNWFFKNSMQHPQWLFKSMWITRKLGILNESIYKFTHRFLSLPTQRNQLYQRWTLFRKFRPYPAALRRIIHQQPLPTLLVFGKYDRIIPPDHADKLMRPPINALKILLLDTGHRLLIPPFASTIAEAILSMPDR